MPEEKDLTDRKYTISQLKTHELCDSVLEQLEKVISLKEDGLNRESGAVMDMLLLEIEKITAQFDESKEKIENLHFDKSTLPRRGQLLAENDMVILRAISDEDYEDYMKVSYGCAIMKSAFKEDAFKKDLWESFLSDTAANFSVYDKVSGELWVTVE